MILLRLSASLRCCHQWLLQQRQRSAHAVASLLRLQAR